MLEKNLANMRILNNGADPNARGNDNQHTWYGSPPYHACQNDYQDAISMLLQSGAKFNGMGSRQDELLEGSITYDPKSSRYPRPKYTKDIWAGNRRRLPPRSPMPSPELQAQR